MRVRMFLGRGWQGFALSDDGRELPAEHGPWRYFKILNLHPSEMHAKLAIQNIEEQGYHIKPSGGSEDI